MKLTTTTSHSFTAKVSIAFDPPMRVETDYGSRTPSEFTTIIVTGSVDDEGEFKPSYWAARGFRVKANGQVGQAPATVSYAGLHRLPREVQDAATEALHEEFHRYYTTEADRRILWAVSQWTDEERSLMFGEDDEEDE